MITLNGKMFAENDSEFVTSLFTHEGTCVGYAKKSKSGVRLEDMQRLHIGTINKHGILCSASKLENGKTWYSFATIKAIGEYASYIQYREECKSALAKMFS